MKTLTRIALVLTTIIGLFATSLLPTNPAHATEDGSLLGASDPVADIYHQVLLKHTVWAEQQWSPTDQVYLNADFRFVVVLGNAVLLSEPGRYDAKITGVDYDTLKDHTLKTITHYAASNRLAGGEQWGKRLFWDTTYEGYFLLAAKLLWEELDETTQQNVDKIATGQASYTVSLGSGNDPMSGSWTPNGLKGGYKGDTKAEEMGVYAQSLAPAVAWYPTNEAHAAWSDQLGVWSRNMTSLHTADLANPATLDGVAISQNTATNIWDTFLVENHDSFGPHYQSEVWRTSARNAIHFLAAGRPLPEVLLTQPNGDELMATIWRTMSDAGEPLMPMVDDREHLFGRDVLPMAYLSQVQGNPYAARAEQNLAERLLAYQDYGLAPRIAKFSGEPKYEPEARSEVAISYLLHQIRNQSEAGPVAAVSDAEFFDHASGVVDHGGNQPGLIAHQSPNAWAGSLDRAAKGMVKFVWQPEHDDWLFNIGGTTPSLLPSASQTVEGRHAQAYTAKRDGFDGSATMLDLASGYAGMTTMPTGSVVYASSGTGAGEGALQVTNLTMPGSGGAPGVPGLDGTRDYVAADGSYTSHDTTVPPAPGKPNHVTRLDSLSFPAGTTARFVRVFGVQPAVSGEGYGLYEMLVRDGASAANLAAGAQVSASSQDAANPAANLTDNDTSTRWKADAPGASDASGWVQVDLGKERHLTGAHLLWDAGAARQYLLQTSTDGTTWTTANYKAEIPGITRAEQIDFAPVEAKYLRMQGVDPLTEFGYSLFEVEARNGATGPNLAATATVSASSQDQAMPATNINDGNYTTRWAVSKADRTRPDSWVQVDLGTATTVDNMRLFWEKATPRAFALQYSLDGTTWKELNFEVPGATRLDDFSFAARDARFVRMQGEVGHPVYGYSVYEFDVLDAGSGVNLARGAKTSATSDLANQPSSKAVDGNYASRWAVDKPDRSKGDAWLTVDLGGVHSIDRVRLAWESAAGQRYRVQTSTDGEVWHDAASFAGDVQSTRFDSNWLTIDNRVGLVVRDSEQPISVVSTAGLDKVSLADGPATPLLVEGYPKTDATTTAQLAKRPTVTTSNPALKASDVDGYLSLFNLSGDAMDGEFTVPAPGNQVALFEGSQQVTDSATIVRRTMPAASASLLAPRFTITSVSGSRPASGIVAEVHGAASLTLTGLPDTTLNLRVTNTATGEARDVVVNGTDRLDVEFDGAPRYPLADRALGATTFPTSPLPAGMDDPDLATDANGCTAWRPGSNGARMVVDLGSVRNLGAVRSVWTTGDVPAGTLSLSADGITYQEIGALSADRAGLTPVSGEGRYLALSVAQWSKDTSAALSTLAVYDSGTSEQVMAGELALCASDVARLDMSVDVRANEQGAWVDPVANPGISLESEGAVSLRLTLHNTGTLPLADVEPTLDGSAVASCARDELAADASYSCEFDIERPLGLVTLAAAAAGRDPWQRETAINLDATVTLVAPPVDPTPTPDPTPPNPTPPAPTPPTPTPDIDPVPPQPVPPAPVPPAPAPPAPVPPAPARPIEPSGNHRKPALPGGLPSHRDRRPAAEAAGPAPSLDPGAVPSATPTTTLAPAPSASASSSPSAPSDPTRQATPSESATAGAPDGKEDADASRRTGAPGWLVPVAALVALGAVGGIAALIARKRSRG